MLICVIINQGPKEIGEDGRIQFEQLEGELVLVCRAAEKYDQGRYTVTLKNEKGLDTAYINLNIVDKPSSPEGPLEVSKITPESCKLAWNPPQVSLCIDDISTNWQVNNYCLLT